MDFSAFEYFIDANKRLYFIYILSSMLIAMGYLMLNKKEARVVLSSKLWLHESAKLDYIYFIVNVYIKIFLIFPLVIGAKEVTMWVYKICIQNFGYVSLDWSYQMVLVCYTFALFLVSDFSRYWVHRWLHTIPVLWEFHKVHHSAKVLTPFTFYRVHPVENLLFGLRYALSIGAVTGLFFYWFGARLDIYTVLGVNIVVFLFNLLGSNLRHTHVKLKYFKAVEKLLVSPYMHQIHHSKKHFDKNYGGYLSLWDRVFGSVKYSQEVKHLKFGLRKEQMASYSTLQGLLFFPFVNLLKKRRISEKFKSFSRVFVSDKCDSCAR